MTDKLKAIHDKRAQLFAQLCQGKIKSYSLRMDGNRIVFESYRDVDRQTIKINSQEANKAGGDDLCNSGLKTPQ